MNTSPLVKAQIKSKEVDVDLTVCFNPKELQVEKSATWQSMNETKDEPRGMFGPATPATLAVTLLFDTYEKKTSVYKDYVAHLERLVHVISSQTIRPPMCIFIWGKFCFPGVIESLSQKYTMFIADGTPVRCEVSLRMKKVRSVVSRFDSHPTADTEEDRNARTYNPLW